MNFSAKNYSLLELGKWASKAEFMRSLDFPMALLENC